MIWAFIGFVFAISLPILTVWKLKSNTISYKPWFLFPLVVFSNFLIFIELFYGIPGNSTYDLIKIIPPCARLETIELAKKAVDGSPMGRTFGLAIIELSNIREISSTSTERQCMASAMLNNGMDQIANYRLFTRDGSSQLFISVNFQ